MNGTDYSRQPPNDVFTLVSQVYQHLTLMLEHNKQAIIERSQKLEALKRRKDELLTTEQHQQRQTKVNSNQQQNTASNDGRRDLIQRPSRNNSSNSASQTRQQSAPPSHYGGVQRSSPYTTNQSIPQPVASSTPIGQIYSAQDQPPPNSTGYLTFSGSSTRSGESPCQRGPASNKPSEVIAGGAVPSRSVLKSPVQRPADPAPRGAMEGSTGFQILHCPDCNAKLGVIFEIFHLDGCKG